MAGYCKAVQLYLMKVFTAVDYKSWQRPEGFEMATIRA